MRISIRPWKREDAPELAETMSNPKVQANLRDGLPYPYTEKDALEYIDAMLAADPSATFAFAVDLDGRAVGSIGAFRKDNIHRRTAEVGYYVGEPFAYNAGSRRVLEKCGFQMEGTLRSNAVRDGKVLDMVMYSKIKI